MKSVVKDYRTGKEYVEIKHKPDLPIKGRANVYIYNARTGALEVEAHTPNIIYPEVYAWLRSYSGINFVPVLITSQFLMAGIGRWIQFF